jgi:hypothetical protein
MQQQGSTGEQAAQQSLANILGQGPQVATGVTAISINPPNAGAAPYSRTVARVARR